MNVCILLWGTQKDKIVRKGVSGTMHAHITVKAKHGTKKSPANIFDTRHTKNPEAGPRKVTLGMRLDDERRMMMMMEGILRWLRRWWFGACFSQLAAALGWRLGWREVHSSMDMFPA